MPQRGRIADDGAGRARRGQRLALILVAIAVIWLGAQVVGAALGLPVRYVFLADLAAMAAFAWCLVAIWRLRRGRSDGNA